MLQDFRITVYANDSMDCLFDITKYNASLSYTLEKEIIDKIDGSMYQNIEIYITFLPSNKIITRRLF